MKALLVCATYGRLPYLGTMLSGFLHQTYDDTELVIVNDDVNVDICCDQPRVTVINCRRRMFVSEKRNIGIASGGQEGIVFSMDDDDIFLPSRVSNHIKEYTDPNVVAYRNTSNYVTYGGKFGISPSPPNDVSYLKSEWFNIGGYNNRTRTGEDTDLYNKLSNVKVAHVPFEKDFIYNWSGLNYHLSNFHDGKNHESMDVIAYKQLQDYNVLGKKFWIEPDYEEYSKYVNLARMYDETQEELDIVHITPGKIDISKYGI